MLHALDQWANSSLQDKTWAEFSTLGLGVLKYSIQLYITKQSNLKLKTRPKQLLGYLLLAFALHA